MKKVDGATVSVVAEDSLGLLDHGGTPAAGALGGRRRLGQRRRFLEEDGKA
jgi:hypothetical protein